MGGAMRTVRDMVKNDELWTPPEAIAPLIPYIRGKRIWEMCPGAGYLINILLDAGFVVYTNAVKTSVRDALNYESGWPYEAIVTNPPWSKKHLFLERCVTLEKPFALLLPVRTLGVRRCQVWLGDVDVLFLKRRVDFTGGGAPYEACAWFTRNLLSDRIVFQDA